MVNSENQIKFAERNYAPKYINKKDKRRKNIMSKHNTLHYLIALLKAYGIKNIVASPGTQNSTFNFFVQEDSDFKCYSVVDERSAAYVALGIAEELNEPVVITCTGATASRNYMSALTEAFYSETPIVACTFYNPHSNNYNMSPQYLDRSVSQNDIKEISVHLPEIKDNTDKTTVITYLNAALSTAKYKHLPVHINVPSAFDYSIKTLPEDIWSTEYIYENFYELKSELKNKNIAVFIGQHKKFSKDDEQAISEFAKSYNIPVICDYTANYKGDNRIPIALLKYIKNTDIRPEIIIDTGCISGVYNKGGIFNNAVCWRITQNNKFSARLNRPVKKLLIGLEKNIFKELKNNEAVNSNFYKLISDRINQIQHPDFPLSCTLMAQQLAKHIPDKSILHLAILRNIENMNLFKLPSDVRVRCNVGGFGIDGPVSTALGQSLADTHKKVFCMTGDLAFFYDMNICGNRHVGNNLRILLENNGEGATMRFNPTLENAWGERQKKLVTAAGHYKNGAKGWAEACGFIYLSAQTKEEFLKQIEDFCKKDYNAPVIFEVFTTIEDDKKAMGLMRQVNTTPTQSQIEPKVKLSKLEKVFSVKNEYSSGKKYKAINLMGVRIKLKAKQKDKP